MTSTYFTTFSKKTTTIRQDTASKLRHIYKGDLPWSPEWKLAQNTKHLWYLALRRLKIQTKTINGKISLTKIRRLMILVNIKEVLSLPTDIVEKKYAEAVTNYKSACKNSPELTETHLDSLDEVMANKTRTSVQTECKKRKNIQRQRETGKALYRLKRANLCWLQSGVQKQRTINHRQKHSSTSL